MSMVEKLPRRRRLRLAHYDYAVPGTYFVTICARGKECVFGYVDDSVGQGLCPCRLSQLGMIVQEEIEHIPDRHPDVSVDKFVVMPNHIHLLLSLALSPAERRARTLPLPSTGNPSQVGRQGQSPCPTVQPALGQVVGAFKSLSTKRANAWQNAPGRRLWQARFHDHVVRGEGDYERIWEYIENNPARWRDDELYCER